MNFLTRGWILLIFFLQCIGVRQIRTYSLRGEFALNNKCPALCSNLMGCIIISAICRTFCNCRSWNTVTSHYSSCWELITLSNTSAICVVSSCHEYKSSQYMGQFDIIAVFAMQKLASGRFAEVTSLTLYRDWVVNCPIIFDGKVCVWPCRNCLNGAMQLWCPIVTSDVEFWRQMSNFDIVASNRSKKPFITVIE